MRKCPRAEAPELLQYGPKALSPPSNMLCGLKFATIQNPAPGINGTPMVGTPIQWQLEWAEELHFVLAA